MSLSEAVRLWNLSENGVRVLPLTRPEATTRVGLFVNVLKVRDGRALLKRGNKTTWVNNLKQCSKLRVGSGRFVTMPTKLAVSLI